jgi:hypothetical protein
MVSITQTACSAILRGFETRRATGSQFISAKQTVERVAEDPADRLGRRSRRLERGGDFPLCAFFKVVLSNLFMNFIDDLNSYYYFLLVKGYR